MGLLKFTLTTFISLLFLACEGEVSSADLFEIKLDGKKKRVLSIRTDRSFYKE